MQKQADYSYNSLVALHRHISTFDLSIDQIVRFASHPCYTLSEIKVQKLSLGRYLFKRYMFVPQKSILVP